MANYTEFETKRLFIAFEIPEDYTSKIINISNDLDRNIWNITNPLDLHITLLWLGDVPISVIPDVITILENITEETNPLSLNRGKTALMMPHNPYMVWMKFEKNKWFEDIVLSLEKYFWRIGTWKQQRDRKQRKVSGEKVMIPHITLARTKDGIDFDSMICPIEAGNQMEIIKLTKIALYESILSGDREVGHYIPIKSFDLKQKKS